jgi:Subtilase family
MRVLCGLKQKGVTMSQESSVYGRTRINRIVPNQLIITGTFEKVAELVQKIESNENRVGDLVFRGVAPVRFDPSQVRLETFDTLEARRKAEDNNIEKQSANISQAVEGEQSIFNDEPLPEYREELRKFAGDDAGRRQRTSWKFIFDGSNDAVQNRDQLIEARHRLIQDNKREGDKELPPSALFIDFNHVFELNHQQVGGSPGLDPFKSTPENFPNQPAWEKIGYTAWQSAYPTEAQNAGSGVTVVVLDASPLSYQSRVQVRGLNIVQNNSRILSPQMVNMTGSVLPDSGWNIPGTPDYKGVANYTPAEIGNAENFTDPAQKDVTHLEVMRYHGVFAVSLIKKIAPQARVILLEIFNDEGESRGDFVSSAIDYFLRKDVQAEYNINPEKLIFSMSLGILNTWGLRVEAGYLYDACYRATTAGALFVVSAGNDSVYNGTLAPEEPAAYGYYPYYHFPTASLAWVERFRQEQVIAVAASGFDSDEYLFFSNAGNIAAPGKFITMDSGNIDPAEVTRYYQWTGTSFAAPFVTGSAAALLSAGKSTREIKQFLVDTARPSSKPNQAPILNLHKAWEKALNITPKPKSLLELILEFLQKLFKIIVGFFRRFFK